MEAVEETDGPIARGKLRGIGHGDEEKWSETEGIEGRGGGEEGKWQESVEGGGE